jgi:hypothetical protein
LIPSHASFELSLLAGGFAVSVGGSKKLKTPLFKKIPAIK